MATTAIQGAGWNGLGHVAAERRPGWDGITAMTRGSVAARQVQQSQAKQLAPPNLRGNGDPYRDADAAGTVKVGPSDIVESTPSVTVIDADAENINACP